MARLKTTGWGLGCLLAWREAAAAAWTDKMEAYVVSASAAEKAQKEADVARAEFIVAEETYFAATEALARAQARKRRAK